MIGEKKFYTVKDISKILDIGINSAYKLVRQKDFPAIIIGRNIRICSDEFEDWVRRSANKDAF